VSLAWNADINAKNKLRYRRESGGHAVSYWKQPYLLSSQKLRLIAHLTSVHFVILNFLLDFPFNFG